LATNSVKILSRIRGCAWIIERFWIGWLDLLTPYKQHSELQAITALSLLCALYSSLLQTD
jgi:hypothetical protein